MDQKQINEAYKKFEIPDYSMPDYSNPEDFSQKFKKCSVLEDVSFCYASDSTSCKIFINK